MKCDQDFLEVITAQLKVGKENINEVGRESGTFTVLCNDIQENGTNQVVDEEAKPHRSLVTDYETSLESEESHSRSDDTLLPIARLETIRLLIALATGKGWKIHHLDVKTAFLHGELKEEVYVIQPEGFEKSGEEKKVMGFQQFMQEKAVYKAVTNGEFIIVVVYVDDLFVIGTSLDCINEFKWRMVSQFEMSDLGELTYYLGIEVSQRKDRVEIKQERYAKKILNEGGMEDCNTTLCPIELGLKLSKMVSCLRYLLHTRPDMTYSVGVVSQYMQSPRESHARVIKQIIRYLKVLRDTFFYLGSSPITWCSQKQTTMALSSCEAEFMATTSAACQAIWLRKVLAEVAENEQVIVEHVSGENQRANPLTNALARIRFKEMRSLLGVQELPSSTQKFRG
ncbi:uncharacterized mitochondrial protein-like protein [Tanacetum coccineum]